MSVALVVGARPQFIKTAALANSFKEYGLDFFIIHTGQHYDYELSQIFFEEFEIPEPDHNLDVGSGFHGYQTGEMLKRCETILREVKPRLVIVYGDTNSTLAGALASVKLKIPVAHVEAGLRSGLRYMPEEINRILVDHISELLFAPTKTAVNKLNEEGIRSEVYLTGDVMLDLFIKFSNQFSKENKDFILVTLHRAENVDTPKRLKSILEALIECCENIVFPLSLIHISEPTRPLYISYAVFCL